jgi:hypothetical protein
MVQFLSIKVFFCISSIFVGFFKSYRFFVSPCTKKLLLSKKSLSYVCDKLRQINAKSVLRSNSFLSTPPQLYTRIAVETQMAERQCVHVTGNMEKDIIVVGRRTARPVISKMDEKYYRHI